MIAEASQRMVHRKKTKIYNIDSFIVRNLICSLESKVIYLPLSFVHSHTALSYFISFSSDEQEEGKLNDKKQSEMEIFQKSQRYLEKRLETEL
jgi:hypothetical protein